MSRRIAASAAHEVVASPCINICKMKAGLCVGCFRTIDEIARWANAGDDGKRLIMAAVVKRKNRPDPAAERGLDCSSA